MMKRRSLLVLASGTLAAPALRAQSFPSQPITFIVAWPPGGGSDIAMRMVAEAASKRMGVPTVVENRPGAAGAVGHRAIVNAKPDGYTLGMFSTAGVAAPYLNPNANTIDELEPIAFFGADYSGMQASNASGIATLAAFLERAKASPGRVKNGNDQPGGASYLAISIFERLMSFKVQKVPYAGYAPTVTALLAGEVDTASLPIPDTIEHHRAGRLKILGIAAPERHFMAPEIPTFRELGQDVVVGTSRSFAGPKGIPPERLEWLRSNMVAAMETEEFKAKARQAGFTTFAGDWRFTAAEWKKEDELLYPILLEAGLVRARQR